MRKISLLYVLQLLQSADCVIKVQPLQSAECVMKVHERGAARIPEARPGPTCAHQPGPHQSWSADQSNPHSSPDSAPIPGTLQVKLTPDDHSTGLQTDTLLSVSQRCCWSMICSCWHCALDAVRCCIVYAALPLPVWCACGDDRESMLCLEDALCMPCLMPCGGLMQCHREQSPWLLWQTLFRHHSNEGLITSHQSTMTRASYADEISSQF